MVLQAEDLEVQVVEFDVRKGENYSSEGDENFAATTGALIQRNKEERRAERRREREERRGGR